MFVNLLFIAAIFAGPASEASTFKDVCEQSLILRGGSLEEQKLYRISTGEPRFSEDGYLTSHSTIRSLNFWDEVASKTKETVPMISSSDVEFMIRFMIDREKLRDVDFFLLEIDPYKIETVLSRKHSLLKNPEHFGFVPRAAIVQKYKISFKRQILREIPIPTDASRAIQNIFKLSADLMIEIDNRVSND